MSQPAGKPSNDDKNDRTIQVFLRVRPMNSGEKAEGHTCSNLKLNPQDTTAVQLNAGEKLRNFNFHRVFGPDSTQEEVYSAYAQQAVESALNGYHGVLFVYGQTGSGKTYTISNEEKGKEGTLQRAVRATWQRIAADTASEYNCSVSYVQLYNEILTDLLEDPGVNNHVRISGVSDKRSDISLLSERTGLQVDKPVNSYEDTMNLFNLGASRKQHAHTSMNANSSRSHTIFTLIIKRSQRAGAGGAGGDDLGAPAPRALEGRLILCDLAGSERISKTKAEGTRVVEATHINGSLLVLGKVVSALSERNHQHVPFRESKLTRVLQYSLSGYGKTSIVVNVGPSDYNTDETLTAIQFGQRAIQIKQTAQQHQILDYKALYVQLQGQLDAQLERAVEAAVSEERRDHEATVKNLRERVALLEEENRILVQNASGKVNPLSGAAFENSNMQLLRKVSEERDQARAEISTLKEKQTQDKAQLFAVARKFEAFRTNVIYERGELMNRINDLSAELAAAKGTAYIAPGMDVNEAAVDDMAKTARGPRGSFGTGMLSGDGSLNPQSPSAASTGSGDGMGGTMGSGLTEAQVMEEQLERAYAAIRVLRDERVQFVIYQEKAKQAIRLLHAELAQRVNTPRP